MVEAMTYPPLNAPTGFRTGRFTTGVSSRRELAWKALLEERRTAVWVVVGEEVVRGRARATRGRSRAAIEGDWRRCWCPWWLGGSSDCV